MTKDNDNIAHPHTLPYHRTQPFIPNNSQLQTSTLLLGPPSQSSSPSFSHNTTTPNPHLTLSPQGFPEPKPKPMLHPIHHPHLIPIILPLFPTHGAFTDGHGVGMVFPGAANVARAEGGAVAEVLVFATGSREHVPLVATGGGVVVGAAHGGGGSGCE